MDSGDQKTLCSTLFFNLSLRKITLSFSVNVNFSNGKITHWLAAQLLHVAFKTALQTRPREQAANHLWRVPDEK